MRPLGRLAQNGPGRSAGGELVAGVTGVDGDDAVVVLMQADVGVLAGRRTVTRRRVGYLKDDGHLRCTTATDVRTLFNKYGNEKSITECLLSCNI